MKRSVALFALGTALAFCAPGGARGSGEPVGAGAAADQAQAQKITLSGRVVDGASGKPLAGATVSCLCSATLTDGEGNFVLTGVDREREANLNFRVMNEYGRIIGCAMVPVPVSLTPVAANLENRFGLRVVETLSDRTDIEIRVVAENGASIDGLCAGCHQPNPCLVEAAQGEAWNGATHLGGLVVQEKEFEALKAKLLAEGIKHEHYANLRYQDAHPKSMNMVKAAAAEKTRGDKFRLPDSLVLTEEGTSTCDTCHTRHALTDNPMFLRLDLGSQTLLCRQCHL